MQGGGARYLGCITIERTTKERDSCPAAICTTSTRGLFVRGTDQDVRVECMSTMYCGLVNPWVRYVSGCIGALYRCSTNVAASPLRTIGGVSRTPAFLVQGHWGVDVWVLDAWRAAFAGHPNCLLLFVFLRLSPQILNLLLAVVSWCLRSPQTKTYLCQRSTADEIPFSALLNNEMSSHLSG